jgi:UPF0176 protein
MLRAVLVLVTVSIFVPTAFAFPMLTSTRCIRKFPPVTWTLHRRQHQVLFSSTDIISANSLSYTGEFTSISFFKFVPISDPSGIVDKVKLQFDTAPGVRGTVLLAEEGVNAQLVVPKLLVDGLPELLSRADSEIFSDININVGQTIDYETSDIPFPFKKLVVREKKMILTDGIPFVDGGIDFSDAGPEVSPSQWHQELRQLNNKENPSPTIVLDCRNSYESEMGTFLHATPLNTTKFSETWLAMADKLAGVPKDTRILTFCTGGIRCVKVIPFRVVEVCSF